MLESLCQCGHPRHLHVDRDNPLQVVPVSTTEADEGDRSEVPALVPGAGRCTVPGCSCQEFTDGEP